VDSEEVISEESSKQILFRRLLAELKEKGIVKYGVIIQNGVKRKVFWL